MINTETVVDGFAIALGTTPIQFGMLIALVLSI